MARDAQLLLRSERDHKAYRLKCRFKIEPHPSQFRLDIEKVWIAERFVRDMRAQGWDNLPGHGFKMRGPFPQIIPTTLHRVRRLTAREMLPHVRQGARFLAGGHDGVSIVPRLSASEWWEYEISGVFSRKAIVMEYPYPHEEERG